MYNTFPKSIVVLVLGAIFSGCSGSSSGAPPISRAGEVQHITPPVPENAMLLLPTFVKYTFYVSHVHGMYITEGDIVVDSDARRASHAAVLAAAESNQLQEFQARPSGNRAGSGYALRSASARADGSATHGGAVYLPHNSSRKFGLYIPSRPSISGYAYVPASGPSAKGVYLPTLSARWQMPIPYCISDRIPELHNNVEAAVAMWSRDTGLQFKEKPQAICDGYDTDNPPAGMIWFIPGDGCDSYVGKLSDIVNTIHLNDDCADIGGVIHEVGHALGLFHEQDRPDRQRYMRIIDANILPGYNNQFYHDPSVPDALYGAYDCNSIMQYPKWAFQKAPGLDTIEPIAGTGCDNIGQRNGPSPEDVSEVKFMYSLR